VREDDPSLGRFVVIELRLLGPIGITARDGHPVTTLVRQSKRMALLSYLAVAAPRGAHRRDKLVAIFWPESTQQHARGALNQSLYVLRSTLGDDAFVLRQDGEVELNRAAVWCDAVAFEEALDANRADEALALYRGDLLDGFFTAEAQGFEQWLEEERRRLRQRTSEGAWTLAQAKAAQGNALEAARWARRAADLAPADEAVMRRVMAFLRTLGDRAAAIQTYEAFVVRLRQEYELEPSAETRELAALIRQEEPPRSPLGVNGLPRQTFAGVGSEAARRTTRPRWLAASALVVATVAAWWWLRESQPVSLPVTRFVLNFADVPPLARGTGGSPIAVSPDGAQLVYLGVGAQHSQLFLRPMDRLEAIALAGTESARVPFFSPDGQWLGFVRGNTIRKLRLTGGPAITVCEVTGNVSGASWGENEVIVYATPAGLWQVSATGGKPVALALADTAHGELYRWPDVLPGSRAAVFTRVTPDGFELAAVSLRTRAVLPLELAGTYPRFVEPGYLLFARPSGELLAALLDAGALKVSGEPFPVADGVLVGSAGAAKLGISRSGALAYVPAPSASPLVFVDRAGHATAVPVPPQVFGTPRFSPDGRWIATAVNRAGDLPDIWVVDVVRRAMRRVTDGGGSVAPAEWDPAGRSVAFPTKPATWGVGFEIRRMGTRERDSAETLVAANDQLLGAFTPDGRSLVFQRRHPTTQYDLWILTLDGERIPRRYLAGPADERAAALSPDGRWIAYVSDESGHDEVYVDAFPKPRGAALVSAGGGREPRWAPNGRELFYRSDEGMVAAALSGASEVHVGPRKVLFDDESYAKWADGAVYDVHPDGQRFVMLRRDPHDGNVVVVLNWLKGRRPGR
jgi:DNA-binding SARP family transcriptional activator/Tol biopolymer transport system component